MSVCAIYIYIYQYILLLMSMRYVMYIRQFDLLFLCIDFFYLIVLLLECVLYFVRRLEHYRE